MRLAQAISAAKITGTLAAAILGCKVIYALFFSPLRNIPGPFLARLTSLRARLINATGKIGNTARKEYLQYGDVYVLEPNAVVVGDPSDARVVLGSHAFVKSPFYEGMDAMGIQNTLSGRDPEFVKMRKRQIGPYFNQAHMAKMEQTIINHGILSLKERWDSQLVQSANGKIEINYDRDFGLAAFDIIGSLAFGQEFNCLKNDDNTVMRWVDATVKLFGAHSMFHALRRFPGSLAVLSWQRQFDKFYKFGQECVARRKEFLAKGGEKPHDILQGFLDAQDPESKVQMTDTQVQIEANIALLAGADTSSNTLKWTIHMLMLHPEILRKGDHVITSAEVRKHLPYVEACLYECLRVFPVVSGLFPRVSPPGGVTFKGHFIPAGTDIYVNFTALGINKNAWEEPLKFDPHGVRICPGRHMAWFELHTIFANMLKDYDLSLPADYTHLGPNVLDESGYPKRMDSVNFLVTVPINAARDCRLILTKHE
ncbi:putative cytochrome P450 monooxygenase [Linderina pennispora]|uniref:Putative cytochrome P450 monooxygenase n=1 Tax=Linderina pennispora TaxID=61395 RepID=A0A1Y1W6G6_9FUNG|nr:putative cytochrome P450 monooxygenase [Linderina pennispora]ORX69147.1 putative cytochrome P450 monooxygenase [Linderina pennispora]